MKYIDMHCDTLQRGFVEGIKSFTSQPNMMIDVERMKKGGVAAQFLAMYMIPQDIHDRFDIKIPEDEVYIQCLYEILQNTIRENPDTLVLTRNYEEYKANREKGRISAFLTFEDGRAVNGRMDNLERFYEMGFRLITLTWNRANCFGFPNSRDPQKMALGLTNFGKEAVEYMGELGMLVDVAHLSDGGFYDVANLVKGPFVASHSDCRALVKHPRNLTDEMIRIIADKGGAIGINFLPEFLRENNEIELISRVTDMVRHIKNMYQVGGADVLAIGTDMDGIEGDLEIDSPDKMHLLFDALSAEGFTTGLLEKMAYKNMERVMKDVLK